MTSLEAALAAINAELVRENVPFALVGGLAVSVRTEPRFTRDADLAVAVATDTEAEALIHRLRLRGYGIQALVEQEAVGRLATVRLSSSGETQAPVAPTRAASLTSAAISARSFRRAFGRRFSRSTGVRPATLPGSSCACLRA